jgi:AraC-like DNA-binding protein
VSGAIVRRVVDRSNADVPEHAHDWPVLSLFVMGAYRNRTELGETLIAGPSAILYRAGAKHANFTASVGFEQIEIEFDPAWLGRTLLPDVPVLRWLGGRTAANARALALGCGRGAHGDLLRTAVREFLEIASVEPEPSRPLWLDAAVRRLRESASVKVSDLAHEVGIHPSWLGTAYRRAIGETLQQTAARLRVERAARLLRESEKSDACVAAEVGFCDQSYMIRTFRRVLGRLPSMVRNDRHHFRQGQVQVAGDLRMPSQARQFSSGPRSG